VTRGVLTACDGAPRGDNPWESEVSAPIRHVRILEWSFSHEKLPRVGLGRFEARFPCERQKLLRKVLRKVQALHNPRQSDQRTACAVLGRDLVSMALRNALRRAASAAPWAIAAPRSLKRPEAGCRAVCSASSARRLAPITRSAACWKGGRSFAAAAECASPSFRPPSHIHAINVGRERLPAERVASPRRARRGPKRPRAIVKIFFPEARRFAFPKWSHRVFWTRHSRTERRRADSTSFSSRTRTRTTIPHPHAEPRQTRRSRRSPCPRCPRR